ncbi:phage repressor protein [Sphingomonas sp. S1-29]|uniref:S24 family peptidase n=1 Tax=Sphingomonas sp. S1-29 TaxID=2991074 RepID=UPI002240859A|nr:S24 family peptidase [Sphingomonas sp. S1-29]UZK70932.1 phage repressor protein [Sphingomonas sp. S1-29]
MESHEQRAALARIAGERGVSLARLSRVLGRNAAYVQQYVARGSPRLLPERERGLLADFLGVAEAALGGPAELHAVPRFDIAASAGPGGVAEIDVPERPARIDPQLLARLGVRAQAASMIRVAGDSMAPTLLDGDEILVDADARLGARAGVYVLRRDGVVMVKRLRRAGGGIDILSDNPAAPSWFGIDPATIAVIGRVAWVSRCLA